MRLPLISLFTAGLLCLAPRLPAQGNWPSTFSFSTDSSSSGSRLGVGLRDIDSDRANVIKLGDARGVEIVNIEDGSPAEQAGLKRGDVMLSYNGETVVGAQQLGRLVSETPRGRKVKIEYWRDGKTSSLVVTTAAASRAMAFADMPDLPRINKLIAPISIPSPNMVWRTPVFGIECESLDSQLAEFFGVKRGVLVRSVSKDSPASRAGVRAGDVVRKIGDRAVSDPRDLVSYVRSERTSSGPASIELTREHKPLTLKITLDSQE